MKRFVVIFLVLIAASAALVAEGSQERPAPFQDGELTTLTGTLKLTDFPPVLVSEGTEVELMVPRYLDIDIDLTEGRQITVEGYLHQGYGYYADGNEDVLRVTAATIDGERIEFGNLGRGSAMTGNPMNGFAGRGGMTGRMGGRPRFAPRG